MYLSDNQRIVLETVRSKGVVAISDIMENSTLSAATSSRLISKLISAKFLEEVDVHQNISSKGRPQKYVKWYGKGYYTISIDVATTKIKGGIMNLDGVFYKLIEVENNPRNSALTCFEKINKIIEDLYNDEIVERRKIIGIGIAFAGLINKDTGVISFSPAFDWQDINPRDLLTSKIDIPIYIDNVTRLMALGEIYLGYGRQYFNFAFINLGFGIGSSIVIGGEIYRGSVGYAGEFGHILTNPDSLVECSCGRRGCLTTTSSGEYIAKNAIERLKNGEQSTLSCYSYSDISAKLIFEEAEKGDVLSRSVLDFAISHLAYRIVDYACIFDPEIVVIGGGLSLSHNYLFGELQSKIDMLHMKCHGVNRIKILPCSLNGKATIIGAGMLVAKGVLNL